MKIQSNCIEIYKNECKKYTINISYCLIHDNLNFNNEIIFINYS